MTRKTKLLILTSSLVVAGSGAITAATILGVKLSRNDTAGVEYSTIAPTKIIDHEKPLTDEEILANKTKKEEEKPVEETPAPPVEETPVIEEEPVAPEPEPEKEPEPEPPAPEPEPTPEPEPVPPVPTPPVEEPPVAEKEPEPAAPSTPIGSGTQNVKPTTAELLRRLKDNGESAQLSKDFVTKGGVGTNSRRLGKNSSVSQPDKFDYESLSAGSQDSAVVLSTLIRNGVTLDNLPTLDEAVSMKDLNSLKENSLRWTGSKVLNFNGQDLNDMLKEFNESLNVQLPLDTVSPTRYSLTDVVALANKDKNGQELTNIEKIIKDRINTYLAKHKPNGMTSIQDVKLKESFSANEISDLEKGLVPSSMNIDATLGAVWSARSAFVNDVLFRTTQQNMNRYLSIESNWERTFDSIMNLDFAAWKGEATNSGYSKSEAIPIPGYENIARLYEYKNLRDQNNPREYRYIVELLRSDLLKEGKTINTLMNEVEKIVRSKNSSWNKNETGLMLAIRNINQSTVKNVEAVVEFMPNTIKSLTMFYNSNNPKGIHALIKNTNFDTKTNTLRELNLYTDTDRNIDDKNTAVERISTLTRIDPRVYQRVNPGAYDYKYNSIFLTMAISKPEPRNVISDTMRYVYVTAKDRREFQGYFGGAGAYPINWDFRDANMFEFNNVNIPSISNFSKFEKVTFSQIKDKTLFYDFRNLVIDNSDRVRYEIGIPSYGMFYADTAVADRDNRSEWATDPNGVTLKVVGTSKRGVAADIRTINNTANASWQYIRHLDFTPTVNKSTGETITNDFTEDIVRRTTWAPLITTIKINGKTLVAGTDFSVSAS
ncbi:putative immunoglobulin-blocking virulence protein [Mycoplasma testudineum]|uniref:Putative immunoglobulin-blocking virulence protein n=1 Tax=Mycoplasma testudineum TaxID=244584 RepID=A0A4R6IBM1_9MOLU|nr:IgG-blocking virulence protein [Mycoplasma testudineum]TDO18996.1 putative immunoglobulin-blocking virulence protein [Mycoplasma testudineum]